MKETYNLEDYEEDTYRCIRCGFCRAVCPVLQEDDMNELVGPRSFVLTAKGVITRDLKPSLKMAERIYQCIECGACNAKCPPGVKIEEIIRATRNRTVESRIQPPRNIKSLINSINRYGRLYNVRSDDESNRKRPLNRAIKQEADVLYYIGCAASQLESDQAKAMIQIMQKAQVDFTVLKEEACCGLPLYTHGFRELFDEKIEKNIEIFQQVKASTLVTTCPGCFRAFSELYPKTNNSYNVLHSSQFIKSLIENGDIRLSKSINNNVTYHDPCDLGRHMGLFDPPREVIKSIPNINFIEVKRNRVEAQCCGAGGGFALAYPNIAKSICATRLKMDVEPTGAETLVTSCPNCTHHFKETINSFKNDYVRKIGVTDLTELIAAILKE